MPPGEAPFHAMCNLAVTAAAVILASVTGHGEAGSTWIIVVAAIVSIALVIQVGTAPIPVGDVQFFVG